MSRTCPPCLGEGRDADLAVCPECQGIGVVTDARHAEIMDDARMIVGRAMTEVLDQPRQEVR